MLLYQAKIRELKKSEMTKYLLPLMQEHNKDISLSVLKQTLRDMLGHGYRCVGAFVNGDCVGVAGFWLGARFWCGRNVDVDNVFVKSAYRQSRIGKQMMDWIEVWAKKHKAKMIVLDSYVSSSKAHKFYFREGYAIAGYHFFKKV
jgi:GNAT superfamily N-acetyltransferase